MSIPFRSPIFEPVPIAPMPLLVMLRDAVLSRSTKRMPKWKFRIAPDIVMQIQPHPDGRRKRSPFECQAVVREQATADMLKDRPRDSWLMGFSLTIGDQGWVLKPMRVGFCCDHPQNGAFAIRDRLIDVMPAVFKNLRPAMMLRPSCLCCGKPLTDPVSMARWIGPECAGTSTALVPFMTVFIGAAA